MWISDEVVTHLRDIAASPALPDGRYRIIRPIGEGGMGRVFEARDERLGRDVAIKVSNTAAAGSELDERLRQEAQILAKLEHPGIVPVHDAGVLDDGRWFYVMKLVKGETLAGHAPRLATEAARLSIFERIVEAVAFAHARHIVHRDLKPANVMIGPFAEVLVMDWGTAPLIEQAGTRLGTRGFMAPEQERGDTAAIGPPADVHALGAMLRWLVNPRPRRLEAIAARCLSERPADRYADAGALARELERYRAGLAVDACPETPWDRFARWFEKYRTFILLIAAYLMMRAVVAWMR
jgi:serine/threonine protein kinase